MSEQSGGPGWWQASDGKWYPPEPGPPPPPPTAPHSQVTNSSPPHQVRRRLSSGLTTTTQVFLYVLAGAAFVAAVAEANELVRFNLFWETGVSTESGDLGEGRAFDFSDSGVSEAFGALSDASDATDAFTVLYLFIAAVLAVLFLVWMNHAYKAAASLGATGQRWSPPWAVGGWFLPLANLVIPKLVMNEIDRMSSPVNGRAPIDQRWVAAPLHTIGRWWWGALIAGLLGWNVGFLLSFPAILDLGVGGYRAGFVAETVGFVMLAGSAICGAILIRRIATRLRG